ncbi:hypothetical protein RDWZM_009518 [Blomia tropicalis]|uniref:Uncharacterized protein n=1 Tax=Blomia tropicalis TaxID=40697 RepID=A0A9Q0RL55_BLOTA|nr:hypothetical protein RDWZM_009518 [Blomia tropicalis]
MHKRHNNLMMFNIADNHNTTQHNKKTKRKRKSSTLKAKRNGPRQAYEYRIDDDDNDK